MNQNIHKFLLWSQKYTGTDMVYIAKNGFWEVMKVIGITITSFVTMFAFARWVPQDVYGSYRYIISAASILAVLSMPGINTSLVSAIARGKHGMLRRATRTRLKWGMLTALGTMAAAGWYLVAGNTTLGLPLLFVAIFLPFAFAFETFEFFWQGRGRFDIQSKYRLATTIIASTVLVSTAFLTDNLIALVLAFFASRAILHAFFYLLSLKSVANEEEDKETISLGKHLTAMGTVSIVGAQLESIILWHFLGPVAVAVFSFARLPIANMQGLIPIDRLALPKLSERNVAEDKKNIFSKFFKLFVVAIPLIVISILSASLIFKLFFPTYLEAVPYFRLLTLTFLWIPFALLDISLVAAGRKKSLYISQTSVPIAKIVLLLILTPLYGIWGAVAAIVLETVFRAGTSFYLFKRL
ncbi:MAG: hypothetical protein A3C03_00580 [Candidatus Colwellbacteria bacterium RIFCSPHIGHO2_02_FULL_45_17]|uniref:Polysaccharide biosynthesis protein C-terminal domain-containing protein n=1 Tax=Candidatus Colwellbacteria bacterium RIFCSPLOWO2_12_FULL_46_17 TaxID=1797695 RepID=A0A1G1ZEL4_9BACT|nr:MAG: hypothetical protein A3C03_00580 [Candidatus Colwellbacteria bacterium RIFCSPHIGHO2_02_FULL_45_17]OGY62586.1 MAG: hypothetical protein A3G58_02840 [Candidatus Colwellbacteria bacterium RIFCSPLOWO2_12_FULL_46_17]